MGIEIERRFLVDGRNQKPWREGNAISMIQHYLSSVIHENGNITWDDVVLINSDEDLSTIKTWRIRKENDVYKLTGKGKRVGSVADEFEWELARDVYNSLTIDELPSTQKTRYLWEGEDGMIWEIDEFEGYLSGLVIAEIELENESQEFLIPKWIGLEVTNFKGWSNASLARMIRDSLID